MKGWGGLASPILLLLFSKIPFPFACESLIFKPYHIIINPFYRFVQLDLVPIHFPE